ncbi:MAG: hypothetical protein JW882_02910 [Deltaproteobacteria bacterium]|nr:hypothetical protein [Deltaproteobacteria bacterium]
MDPISIGIGILGIFGDKIGDYLGNAISEVTKNIDLGKAVDNLGDGLAQMANNHGHEALKEFWEAARNICDVFKK